MAGLLRRPQPSRHRIRALRIGLRGQVHVVLQGSFRARLSEPLLRHLDGYALIMQNGRMPVPQQMPGHMGDSQLPYGGPDNPLEDIVGKKGGVPRVLRKSQSSSFERAHAFPNFLSLARSLLLIRIGRWLGCVFGESISPLCTASRTQRQLCCQSMALQRRANNSLTRTPVAQVNHTIVRYGSSKASWSCWSSLSLGSFGWNLTGSWGISTERTGFTLR